MRKVDIKTRKLILKQFILVTGMRPRSVKGWGRKETVSRDGGHGQRQGTQSEKQRLSHKRHGGAQLEIGGQLERWRDTDRNGEAW